MRGAGCTILQWYDPINPGGHLLKFALNYSPEAAALLTAGQIHIDLFKCPNWDDLVPQAAALLPVYIHFPFQAGQADSEQVGFESVRRWLAATETRYVNTHISPLQEGLANPDDPEEVFAKVLPDVLRLVEEFGADRVIAENIPYPETDTKKQKPLLASDAALITRVIEAAGCGLLLDLGHARRMAEHLAIDPRRYIEQLPVTRLRELHVTGLGYNAHGRRVDHLPMTEEDWLLLDWALDNIRQGNWSEPYVVACEYGGVGPGFEWRSRSDVIAAQIPRMVDMVRAAQPVLHTAL